MRISDKGAELMRTEQIKAPRVPGGDSNAREVTQPVQPVKRADQVQISDAGRQLAAKTGGATDPAGPAEVGPERATEIRRRVLEGAYNSLNVVDQVARRMLQSGDV